MVRRSLAVLVASLALAGLIAPAVQSATLVRATFGGGDPAFRPKRVEINRGTRVVWKSVSGTHTVTSYGGGWSKNTTISSGERTGFTFNNNGTYRYRCTLHSDLSAGNCSGMCGRVVVG